MSEANSAPAAAAPEVAPAATSVVDGAAPAAPAVGAEQQQSSEAGQGAPQGEGQGAGNEKPADAGAPAEGEKPKGEEGAEAQGAPADGKYADFVVPEGIELAGDMLEGVTTLAKAHNLNQAQAQALVDLGVKQASQIAERFAEQVSKAPVALPAHWASKWSEQTSADPMLGGENLKTTMALAGRVFATFASPELGAFLNETGLAHHPELIRFMHQVGKAVSEDTLVAPSGGQSKTPVGRDPAKKLYPGMA